MMTRSIRRQPCPGEQFQKTYKGDTYTLTVVETPDGIRYRIEEYSDELFTSPTTAAKWLVPDGQSINGRSFWKVDVPRIRS
jgi:hypothetical protein